MLTDNLKIQRMERDTRNITILKKVFDKNGKPSVDKHGKEKWSSIERYYPTFEKAIAGALRYLGEEKITYQDAVDGHVKELSQIRSTMTLILEKVSAMAPSCFCEDCPYSKKKKGQGGIR